MRKRIVLMATAAISMAAMSSAHADVLYRSVFANDGYTANGGFQRLNSAGYTDEINWQGWYDGYGITGSSRLMAEGTLAHFPQPSTPNAGYNTAVNSANPISVSHPTLGAVYESTLGGGQPTWFMGTSTNIGFSASNNASNNTVSSGSSVFDYNGPTLNSTNITSIEWDSQAYSDGWNYAAAIKVGSTWYTSNHPINELVDGLPYTGGQDNANSTVWQHNVDTFASDQWIAINVDSSGTAGAPYTASEITGTPVALPSGTVTGFGLYMAQYNQFGAQHGIAITNYSVNGTAPSVPEPATLSLLGLSSAGLLFRRRKA